MTKIFISAGHHAASPGVSGNGLQEHVINLTVALELERLLLNVSGGSKYRVLMARITHAAITLQERVRRANAWGADIFIDIHHNGHSNPSSEGIETFHSVRTHQSKQLASRVQRQLSLAFPSMEDRGIKESRRPDGRDTFFVLRDSTARAAILTECGFVTNAENAAIMRAPDFAARQARAILAGVEAYTYFIAPTPAPAPAPAPRLIVNGREVEKSRLKVEDGRIYILLDGVPPQRHWIQVRALSELLGGNLVWDGPARLATLIMG